MVADGSYAQLSAAGGFSAELGGGCAEAAAELDDAAYDEGISDAVTASHTAEATTSDDRKVKANARSGSLLAKATQSDGRAAEAGARSGDPAAEVTPSDARTPAAQTILPEDVSAGHGVPSHGAETGQEHSRDGVDPKAHPQAKVPQSVFGTVGSGGEEKYIGESPGASGNNSGPKTGKRYTSLNSGVSGFNTAASRMRRELSR